MASITSTGIGSGLDVASLVQQLVAAEGQPTEIRIARKEAEFQARLSALGSVKSSLASFKTQLEKMSELESLLTRSASAADEDLLTVSADETALPGVYDIEVVQLAQTQQLRSAVFTGTGAVVGTGTLNISVGSESFSVEIDDSNNTVAGIQNAINVALENRGVSATIVNADAGSYLFLTGDNTGSDQAITVTQSGGDGGLSVLEYDPDNGLLALTETAAAQDALIRVNGFDVTSDNNTVVGAVEGVTIDLFATNAGSTTQIAIDNDRDAVKGEIQAFVDAYNELISTFENQTGYDTVTERGGPLLGDATIRGVRDQLRRELSIEVRDIDATFDSLLDIGIETDIEGRLTLDSSRLDEILGSEFAKLGQLFANSDGYAPRLTGIIDSYIDDTDGVLSKRVEGIEGSVEDLADQREALNVRLTSLEARLLKQFNALDALVGQLQTTSTFLTQQLASLPKIEVSRNR
jgi:flagellar hook-associated protein 2